MDSATQTLAYVRKETAEERRVLCRFGDLEGVARVVEEGSGEHLDKGSCGFAFLSEKYLGNTEEIGGDD